MAPKDTEERSDIVASDTGMSEADRDRALAFAEQYAERNKELLERLAR